MWEKCLNQITSYEIAVIPDKKKRNDSVSPMRSMRLMAAIGWFAEEK
jgi:hypothetical protein